MGLWVTSPLSLFLACPSHNAREETQIVVHPSPPVRSFKL